MVFLLMFHGKVLETQSFAIIGQVHFSMINFFYATCQSCSDLPGWTTVLMMSVKKEDESNRLILIPNFSNKLCWTEGRSSMAEAEDLRPTATATVAEV